MSSLKLLTTLTVSGVLAIALGATASAQIFQSGGVYHVRACPGPDVDGAARCHAHYVSDASGRIVADRFMANRLERNAKSNTVPAGYGPTALASAYNPAATAYPSGVGSSVTIIAIVDAYGYPNAESDLAIYRSTFGLPACTSSTKCFTKVNQAGQLSNYPRQDTGWSQETALDLDMTSAMCPNCRLLLVEANSQGFADLAMAENTAARLGAHVISNSYGGRENGSTSYNSAYNHQGVAVIVSTGDSGYGAGPQFPATSNYVTAVGGTSLRQAANARGWTESAWAEGGSGCSKLYPKPTWQAAITLCTMRMEADVSAVGDPATGVAVYGPVNTSQSGWGVYGGTSVAAPLIAGIYAVNGGVVSYGSNPYKATAYLNDVASGSNGNCGGTYFCTARAGYDGPTGLGTPIGAPAF